MLLLLLLLKCPLLWVMLLVLVLLFLSLLFADFGYVVARVAAVGVVVVLVVGFVAAVVVVVFAEVYGKPFTLELLRHSLELLERFFNIQRASCSLAKTGLFFDVFGDFLGVLF